MNNNNRGNNNNRRRGRGNNNNRQQGGGQQLNRIDSRARGNAPQLLEKYRKLAHDAHLNGDRVQEEYFLQFADHYFRVLADQRQRQDEQRAQRNERWQENAENGEREDGETTGEFGEEGGDYATYDRPQYTTRNDRDYSRNERSDRNDRAERSDRMDRNRDSAGADLGDAEGVDGDGARISYAPQENPFVRDNRDNRDNRGTRGGRSVRPRRNEPRPSRDNSVRGDTDRDIGENETSQGFDASILPPAISVAPEVEASTEIPEVKPRRRVTRKRPTDDAGEALEAVS